MLMADYFSASNSDADHKPVSHQEIYEGARTYWEQAIPQASGAEKRLLHSSLAKLGVNTGNYYC